MSSILDLLYQRIIDAILAHPHTGKFGRHLFYLGLKNNIERPRQFLCNTIHLILFPPNHRLTQKPLPLQWLLITDQV